MATIKEDIAVIKTDIKYIKEAVTPLQERVRALESQSWKLIGGASVIAIVVPIIITLMLR